MHSLLLSCFHLHGLQIAEQLSKQFNVHKEQDAEPYFVCISLHQPLSPQWPNITSNGLLRMQIEQCCLKSRTGERLELPRRVDRTHEVYAYPQLHGGLPYYSPAWHNAKPLGCHMQIAVAKTTSAPLFVHLRLPC